MPVLLWALLLVLLVPSAARADCCTYEAPSVGDLVADDAGAWLTYDAPELLDDARTHQGAVVRLTDGAPKATALRTTTAGAGLPATDGTTLVWAQVDTGAELGPGRMTPLAGLDPAAAAATATLPADHVQVRGADVVWRTGESLHRLGAADAIPGVTDFALLADGRVAFVRRRTLKLGTTDLGPAREVLDADVRDGTVRIVVNDARGRSTAGSTVLVTVAADGTTTRRTIAKAQGNPAAALDGEHVVHLAKGRAGAADVVVRPVAGGAARNLTRTAAAETSVVADGGLVAYGRGFQPRTARVLVRTADGRGPERIAGGAQPRRFSQLRLAVQPDGTAHLAFVDRGTRDSGYCGGLVVRRLDAGGRFGKLTEIAACSVGTTA